MVLSPTSYITRSSALPKNPVEAFVHLYDIPTDAKVLRSFYVLLFTMKDPVGEEGDIWLSSTGQIATCHIQSCHRIHCGRIRHHDAVSDPVDVALPNAGCTVVQEQ
ncbi:hypothetical protein J6590_034734 [Homalodisca vitripennis]|nr:hypothetical protein J6590_034734 [Homalodisca vitripennis]